MCDNDKIRTQAKPSSRFNLSCVNLASRPSRRPVRAYRQKFYISISMHTGSLP